MFSVINFPEGAKQNGAKSGFCIWGTVGWMNGRYAGSSDSGGKMLREDFFVERGNEKWNNNSAARQSPGGCFIDPV